MYINAYRCKAVGLTVNEVNCLEFAASKAPDEKLMAQLFAAIPLKLERYGLIEKTVDGVWQITAAGLVKLNAVLPARREAA